MNHNVDVTLFSSFALWHTIRSLISHSHWISFHLFVNNSVLPTQIQYLSFTLKVDGHWSSTQAKRAKFLSLSPKTAQINNTREKNIKMSAQFFVAAKSVQCVRNLFMICLVSFKIRLQCQKIFAVFLSDVVKYTKLSPTYYLDPIRFHQYSNSNK